MDATESLIAFTDYTNFGYVSAAHHRLIAQKLEAVERGEIDRLAIFMPPRHGKSELASRRFPAWYLGRNPDRQIIAASYNSDLASDFGREVRNIVASPEYAAVFDTRMREDSRAAERWNTDQGGSYVAVGVGTAVTGRGAHILLIDDPLKGREEADSEIRRQRVWEWYTSTAYTRLMPGGAVILIQCMTGDTPVLMATGSEKPLRDIRRGDVVATYENGKLSTSTVRNWINNGPDRVFEIRMKSGITVRANARHPFLVEEGGEQKWRRTATLKKGSVILKAIGVSGKTPRAQSQVATSPSCAKACAVRTTTNIVGRLGLGRHLSTLRLGVRRICATATELAYQSMRGFLLNKAEFAPCASSHQRARTQGRIGTINFASITATTVKRLGGFSVTTAILRSVMEKLKQSFSPPLRTFAITRDTVVEVVEAGIEDVFDVQIDRTENFIANGLVSHNTRWHEDDLAGRLLNQASGDRWEVLELPALDESGKALWPEWYNAQSLDRIRAAIGPREWSALYQQRPAPEEGDYFKAEWLRPYDTPPAREMLRVYGGSDYAVTADGGDYTVHAVVGLDPEGRMYLLDLWRKQASADEWIEAFCDLVKEWKPIGWAEETGQIRSGVGPFLIRRQRENNAYVARQQFPTRGDKAVRAQSIRGRMALEGLYVPINAKWYPALRSELLSFPAGKHDDQVDALGLVGQLLDYMSHGEKPAEDGEPVNRSGYSAYESNSVENDWITY